MMYEFEFTHPNKKRRKVKVQANSDQAQDLAQLATAAYESKYGVLPHEHGFKWREPKTQSEKDAEGWLNLAKAFGREPIEELTEPDPKADVEDIDRPDRYLQNEIDFIEAMFLLLPWEQFKGFMKATAMRYPFRYEHKGGGLDLDKSINYLQRLKEYEGRRK